MRSEMVGVEVGNCDVVDILILYVICMILVVIFCLGIYFS